MSSIGDPLPVATSYTYCLFDEYSIHLCVYYGDYGTLFLRSSLTYNLTYPLSRDAITSKKSENQKKATSPCSCWLDGIS